MNQDRTKRKLTAIFSADVVEYSRLIESDEAWTIKSLEENRRLMSSLIEGHNGRVVDSPGDNLLAEFGSVINAVECAVKVQEELNIKNSKLMEDNRMHFRIGVNLGDVVEEEDRIYGNGVNIAARLEGLAEPGGICISGTAYDQVIAKLNLEYEYLGEHSVKNIAIPIRVYRVVINIDAARKIFVKNRFLSRIGIVGFITCIAAAISLTALIIEAAIWYLKPAPPAEPRPVMRSEYVLPEDQQLFRALDGRFHLAVSPDGSQFAYSTTKGIYIRSMSELDARLISGTNEDASSLFFSPDGQWIGYFSTTDKKLKRISVSGGAPTNLCDITVGAHAYWYEDNTIVYSDFFSGVYRIPAKGGTPEVLVEGPKFAGGKLLPDGQSVMFLDLSSQPYKTMVQSLDTGEQKVVLESAVGSYSPTGHLVYSAENNLFAVPFDLEKLEITGGAVSLMETPLGSAHSDSGTLVYVPRTADAGGSSVSPKHTLVWVDQQGKETPLKEDPGDYGDFKISPDGKGVALTVNKESNTDIWVLDLVRNNMRRLTFHVGDDNNPLWTPDSQRILYQRFDTGRSNIYSKAANGTGEEEKIVSASERVLFPWSWSSEGKTLVLWELTLTPMQFDIGIVAMEGENLRNPLLADKKFNEGDPQVSPDGQWLAYHSDESGQFQVYVSSFPQVDKGKWQVSLDGGISPRWSPDGRKLYYQRENSVIAVDVEMEPVFNPGNEEILFEGNYLTLQPNTQFSSVLWDVHPDGNKFLMMKEERRTGDESTTEESEAANPRKIIIVTNWDEEFKQRVPVE